MRALRAALRDPVYANGGALVLSAVVNAGLGFVFWMAAARLLEPGALGFGAAVVSAATLAALLGKTGIDAAVVRFIPAASRATATRFLLRSTLATCGVTGVFALAIVAATWGPAESLAPLREPLVALGFAALACAIAATWVMDAYFLAEQRAIVTLARNVVFQLVKLGLLLLAVGWLAGFAVPLVWAAGVAASLVLTAALARSTLSQRPRHDLPLPTRREVAHYAGRNYALNVAEFAPGLVLPMIVLETLGSEANAGFYLAWTVATVGFLASKAIAQSAFAALVRVGDARQALVKGVRMSALVLIPFILVCLLAADLVLGLFGSHYSGSATLLRLLALSLPALAASNLYLAYLKARRAGAELVLLPSATMALLALAMPVALVKRGVEGLGAAWLAVQTLSGVYALLRTRRIARTQGVGPHVGIHLSRRPHEG